MTDTSFRDAHQSLLATRVRTRDLEAVAPYIARMLPELLSVEAWGGATYDVAVNRQRRALAEFRIRGVASNIGFLRAVLDDPAFIRGDLSTNFIEERPHLLEARVGADRGSKVLEYLADVTVNQPYGPSPVDLKPSEKLPQLELSEKTPASSRNSLLELGPEG